jgi:hypothetical protein
MAAVLTNVGFAADVNGKWVGKVETPNGATRDVSYSLKQEGEKLSGTTNARDGAALLLTDGSVKGEDIAFSVLRTFNGEEMKVHYKGKLAGKTIKLKYEMMGQDRELTLSRE